LLDVINDPPDCGLVAVAALPVVFWFNVGNVQLAKLPDDGVPKAGDTKVGLLDNTTLPEPVDAVTPVPPLATGKVPVTPVVSGSPVTLVITPLAGVPKAGVTSVGLLERTALPVPVDVVTPVPPRATERVPVVPAIIGRPVALVNVTDAGVPSVGFDNVGLLDSTTLPVPVEVVTPVPPRATGSVPVVPPSIGRPVTLVITPLAGVPKAGEVNVGLVSVLFVSVWVPDNVATVESIATVTAEEPL
jgi:hypothetical protein